MNLAVRSHLIAWNCGKYTAALLNHFIHTYTVQLHRLLVELQRSPCFHLHLTTCFGHTGQPRAEKFIFVCSAFRFSRRFVFQWWYCRHMFAVHTHWRPEHTIHEVHVSAKNRKQDAGRRTQESLYTPYTTLRNIKQFLKTFYILNFNKTKLN
jgi:hypothetical protein